jgi:hypothetical protein
MVRSMLAALEHSGKRRRERRRDAVDRLRQEGRSRLWSGEFESAEDTRESRPARARGPRSGARPSRSLEGAASSSAPSRPCSGRARLGPDPQLLTVIARLALAAVIPAPPSRRSAGRASATRQPVPPLRARQGLGLQGRFAEAADARDAVSPLRRSAPPRRRGRVEHAQLPRGRGSEPSRGRDEG